MAVYYKPQSPIQSGEDFIYPITTADQVKVDKDTRLNAVGVYLKNIDNSTDTTVYGNNATTLGGVAAEDYALKTDTAPDSSKLGGVAASDYALKTDTAPDSSKLGGKAPEYYIQPRNLLDNSDFTNPVNQRGATSYSGTGYKGYTIDRWRLHFANSTGQLDVTPSGIKFTLQDNNAYFDEMLDLDTSKTYTFAAMVNGELSLISGVPDNNVNNGVILLGKSGGGYLRAGFCKKGEDTIVTWAALYEGAYTADTRPPYVPKGYAAELAECRRYFEVINFTSVFSKKNYEGNVIYCAVNFGVKRVNPTITIKNLYSPGTYSQSQLGTLTIGDKEKTCVQLLSSFVDAEGKCVWGKLEVSADL